MKKTIFQFFYWVDGLPDMQKLFVYILLAWVTMYLLVSVVRFLAFLFKLVFKRKRENSRTKTPDDMTDEELAAYEIGILPEGYKQLPGAGVFVYDHVTGHLITHRKDRHLSSREIGEKNWWQCRALSQAHAREKLYKEFPHLIPNE